MNEPQRQDQPPTPDTRSQPGARSGVRCMSCGYDLMGVRIGDRCPECGTQVLQFAGQPTQTSGKAIASMVLGIISIISCGAYGVIGMPCAILALHFGKKARLAIQAGAAPASSQSMASAGRICGWIGVGLNAFALLFLLFYLLLIIGVIASSAAGAGGGGGAPVTPAPTPLGP